MVSNAPWIVEEKLLIDKNKLSNLKGISTDCPNEKLKLRLVVEF